MLADAIETLVDRPRFKARVGSVGPNGVVAVEANEPATFAAFILQRLREQSGKSLADVALTMGKSSKNAFARYEQGEAVPTIDKFEELLQAIAPGMTVCITSRDLSQGGFRLVAEMPVERSHASEGSGILYQDLGDAFRKTRSRRQVVLRTANSRGARGVGSVINPKKKVATKPTARRSRGSVKPAQR